MRVMLIVVVFLAGASNAFADVEAGSDSTATSIRMAGCRTLQSQFDRVVFAHTGDPAVESAQKQLVALDGAADAVLRDLSLYQSAFLNQSLATICRSDDAGDQSQQLLSAAAIVDRYGGASASDDAMTKLNLEDRDALRKYMNLAARTLSDVIHVKGLRCVRGVGADTAEIARLSFVVEMLASDANGDLSAAEPHLPEWMRRCRGLKDLQAFAIESGRPRVAFALEKSFATTAPADMSTAYLAFATEQADAMLRDAKYLAALACLRDAAEVASTAKQAARDVQLRFRIAEVLEATDANAEAANEMDHIRSICHDQADFARASMLRLKYLHAAGQDDEVIAEAAADLKEPRCEANLPQIIYIAWLTAREERGGDSQTWQKAFLERYPDQPLAAEIYFTSATDALAEGHYETALRVLQFIEYRFPEFRLIAKVRTLSDRLQRRESENHQSNPAVADGK